MSKYDNGDILDVIIVGSGPAGLSAAIYTKRAGLNTVVVEKDYMGAGQIVYSDKVDNYLGIPAISGFDLGESFRSHAESLGVVIEESEVTYINKQEDNEALLWKVDFLDGAYKLARTVIYAAGSHHRHLGIKEEEEFIGKGVSYCAVCDGAFFKDKNVVVVGGGNSALGDAMYLSDICANVYIAHRREEFKGDAATLDKLKNKDNVHIITGVTVKSLKGDKRLEEVILSDGQVISANGLFVAIGMAPETDILKDIVKLDDTGYVVATENCVTSSPGFYAAGDVRTKEVRQLITAAADGAVAAAQVIKYLR